MHASANERWRYSVTPSLIGWAHTQCDPAIVLFVLNSADVCDEYQTKLYSEQLTVSLNIFTSLFATHL